MDTFGPNFLLKVLPGVAIKQKTTGPPPALRPGNDASSPTNKTGIVSCNVGGPGDNKASVPAANSSLVDEYLRLQLLAREANPIVNTYPPNCQRCWAGLASPPSLKALGSSGAAPLHHWTSPEMAGIVSEPVAWQTTDERCVKYNQRT